MKQLIRNILPTVLAALLTWGLWAAPALADTSTDGGPGVEPGVRIGAWLQRNVAALFAPILAIIALYYLVKRQFTQFLSFAVFAAIAALFIFGAGEFKDAALSFVHWSCWPVWSPWTPGR